MSRKILKNIRSNVKVPGNYVLKSDHNTVITVSQYNALDSEEKALYEVGEYAPKLPQASDIEYGEIAINYGDGVETISLRNENNEIVEFASKTYVSEKAAEIVEANAYELPTASDSVLGGVKVGTNLSIDANGVLSSTDTNTTYEFAGGTNKFTVTPSSGTAQEVSVTPSIDNNVTGAAAWTAADVITTTNAASGNVIKASGKTISTTAPSGSSDDATIPTSAAVWTAISNGIEALDGGTIGTGGTGKTITSLSQSNGNVSATFENISITKSQISDFPTIPTVPTFSTLTLSDTAQAYDGTHTLKVQDGTSSQKGIVQLGTTAGTAFDGADGNTAKTETDFLTGATTTNSAASISVAHRLVILTNPGSASLTLASLPPAGREIHILINATSAATITIPHGTISGINYVNVNDMEVNKILDIEAGKYGEINIISDGSKAYVRYI